MVLPMLDAWEELISLFKDGAIGVG